MKLISMTDFVLEQKKLKIMRLVKFHRIENYANFLKQPLELWMFVPCDEDGNVLEEPNLVLNFMNKEGYFNYDGFEKAKSQYQQAKEKCLFDGYEIAIKHHISQKRTIEYLANLGTLQLTETAVKHLEFKTKL